MPIPGSSLKKESPRHSATTRLTHWITFACFVALLVTGVELIISHPRFYWGETGNVNMKPAFSFPIPSSRATVPTGYGYVMPDQNGWSRYLHFQAAWLLVLAGAAYLIAGFWTRHIQRDLLPEKGQRNVGAVLARMIQYLRRRPAGAEEAARYNVLQRVAYLKVIFVIVPLLVWTGLALSPTFEGAFPWAVIVLGGRQSARTLHFLLTCVLTAFFVVHMVMVTSLGFWSRTRAMITGRAAEPKERG